MYVGRSRHFAIIARPLWALSLGVATALLSCATAVAQPANEEFASTAAVPCCETQACQQQAYRELERQRYAAAKRCVEARAAPCDIQPELVLPPLCPPKLEGKTERILLEGGADKSDTTGDAPPPVFIEQTPTLDPREQPITPRKPPPAAIPPPTESVSGKVLPRPKPATPPQPAARKPTGKPATTPTPRGDVDLVRVPTVSGSILRRQELPGDPAAGGTPSTPFTRAYFFSQGVMHGLFGSGREAGVSAGHLTTGAWYVLTNQPQLAQQELNLIPGQSVTVRALIKDLGEWSQIIAGDPKTSGSVQDAYNRGHLLGSQIGGKLLEKYGGTVLQPTGVPVVTEPPPVPQAPPSASASRQEQP